MEEDVRVLRLLVLRVVVLSPNAALPDYEEKRIGHLRARRDAIGYPMYVSFDLLALLTLVGINIKAIDARDRANNASVTRELIQRRPVRKARLDSDQDEP